MSDSTDADSSECRTCNQPVADSRDRRVVTTVEDGAAVHLHFCDDDCLEVWESEAGA